MSVLVSSNVRFVTLSAMLGAMTVIGEPTVAQAGAVPFTWAPSAIAGVGNGASTFSADSIVIKNYIRTTNVNDFTALKQTFSGSQYETVSSFTLNGAPVNATGLGTSYGLYFAITPAGSFPINSSGATVGPATYTKLDVTLYADVGADDGTISTGPSGIGFSNPAGTANDMTLATGSLISAALAVTPTGGRTAAYALTFQPLAGESGFFASPGIPLSLQVSLLTPAAAFAITPINSTTVISTADGNLGSGGTIQLVPEPASTAMLTAGLLGLMLLRRRGRSRT